MAKPCSNFVSFTGNEENLEAIKALFREIEERQTKDQTYYLPEYVTAEHSYMFDIQVAKDNIMFETRWVPNIETLMQIADHYKVGFFVKYEGLGNMTFGRATYENGQLNVVDLYLDDFGSYDYNKAEKTYTYQGKIYNHEVEILELLLKKKSGPEIPPDQFITR